MRKNFSLFILSVPAAAILTLSLYGQKPGGTPTGPGASPGGVGSTGNSPGGITTPGRNNPTNTIPNSTTTPRPGDPGFGAGQPVYISGKVMLEDGTAPAEPVLIERICGSNPRPEGYTDHKGRFSFALGQNNALLADASVANTPSPSNRNSTPGMGNTNITPQMLMNCELRASLPGFRSSIVRRRDHRPARAADPANGDTGASEGFARSVAAPGVEGIPPRSPTSSR